jgi:NAD(P)-dependent dehydrogenase (short-subunit alcohol dehydrogenase family)
MLLENKVMVVSGVGPGLGREIAVAGAREGASVMMGARTEANLKAAADEIDPSGKRVGWVQTDITDPAACQRLADAAVEKFGKLDALVNCAAFDTVFGGVQEADFEEWRTVFDTNVIGTLQVCRAAIPHLKKNGGGAIVFIGSQGMFWPPKGFFQTAYQSSKAGLVSAVYHLANELGADKIRVNTVVPTWMWGPPVEGYVNSTAEAQGVPVEQIVAGITQNMALGEIPTDGDVAEAVIFFASDRARMITAQTLMVNAGEFPH